MQARALPLLLVTTAIVVVAGCGAGQPARETESVRQVDGSTDAASVAEGVAAHGAPDEAGDGADDGADDEAGDGATGAEPLSGLAVLEEATEALANRLLDMSVAARTARPDALEPYFADRVRLVLPEPEGVAVDEVAGVRRRAWTVDATGDLSTSAAASALAGFLQRFPSREDVRVKVTDSILDDADAERPRLTGAFKSFVVGRDATGRREWFRGKGRFAAVRDEGAWRLEELAWSPEKIGSMVADRDIFSEVSEPAGLARRDPSFVERGAQALLAHGAATADVNGDGWLDIFSPSIDSNALYLARGDGTYEEVAAASGLGTFARPGVAPLFLDIDGDSDLDLFVSAIGEQMLFENRLVPDGRLFFRDVSDRAGVAVDAVGMSASAGDLDADGDPDIVVASYNHYGRVVPDAWDGATNGLPNRVFLNDGDGTFREAGAELGLDDSRWSYAVTVADVTGDGRLEVVVGNDFGAAVGLFVRKGDGGDDDGGDTDDLVYVDEAARRGLGDPAYGMGVALGDPDADGDLDLHVTKMSSTAGRRILGRIDDEELPRRDVLTRLAAGNSLYENQGDGTFRDVSASAGPFGGGWAWGGGFLDVDNDGAVDLYTPNGFISGKSLHDT